MIHVDFSITKLKRKKNIYLIFKVIVFQIIKTLILNLSFCLF